MDISSSLDAFEQAPEYTALAPEDRAKALDGWKSWAVKSFTGPEDTPEVTDQLVEEALSAKKSRERSRLRPDNTGILPPLVPDWGEVSADPAFAQLGTPERQKVADSWAARKAAQLNQVALTSEDRASWLVQREAAKRQAAGEQGLPEVSELLRPIQYQAFTEARNPVLPTGLVQADPTTGGLSVHPALALRSKEEYDRMIDEALPGGSPEALDEKAKYDARRGAALGAALSGLGAQEDTEARNLWASLLPGAGLIDRTVNEFFDIFPDLKITVPDPVSGKNITKVIPGDEASFYISDVREARYKSDGASAEPLLSSDPDIREPAEQKLLDDLGRHVLPNLDLELAERVRKNPQSEEARAIITEMQDKLRRELWVEPDEAKKNSFEQVRILSDGEAVWNPELIDSMSRPEIQSAVASLSLPEDRAQQILEQGLRERQQKAQEEVSNIRLLGPVEGDDSSFSVSMFGPTTDAYRSFVLSRLDSAEFKEGRIDEADILAEWKAKNTGLVPAVRVAGQRALSAVPGYLADLTLMLSGFAASAVNKIGIDTPEFSQWINDNSEANQLVQQIAAKSETTGVQRIAGMLGREGPFLLTGIGVGIRAGLAAATANTLAQNALKEAIVTLGRRRAASSTGMGVGTRKTAEEYRAVIRAFALKERATASARALRDGTGAAMLTYQGLQASRSSVDTYQNVYVALKQKGVAEGLSEQAAQERARTGAIAPAITSGVITGTLMKLMPGGVEALVARAGGKVPLKQLAASAGPAKLAEVLRSKAWIAPAAGVIASVFNGVLREAAEESLDEFMQVVVQSDYNESLTLNDAVSAAVEAAVVGGIMGGLSGGVTGVSDLRSLALKNREDKIAHARDMAKKAAKVDRLIEDLEEKQAPQTAEALADLLEGKAQDRIDAEIKALTELGMSSVPLEAEDGVPISDSDATYESAAFATDIEATDAMTKLRTRFDEILAKDPTHPVGEFALMVISDGESGYRVHAIRDEGSVADFKARLEQNIKPGTEGVAAPAAEGDPAPLTEGTPPPAEGEPTPPAEGETTPPADTAPAPGDPLPELSVQEGDRAELPAVLEGLDEFRRAVQGRMRQTGTGTKAVTAFREKLEKVNALVREIAGLYRRYFATEKGSLEFDLVSDELAAALSKMDGMLAASPAVRQRVKQKVRPPAVIEEEAAKAAAEPEAAAEAENLFPDRVPTGEAADAAVGAVQAAFAAEENKPRRAALRKNAAAMANAEAAYTNDPSAENELTLLKAARNMRSRFAAGSAEYAAVNDLVKDLQSKQDARKEAVRKQQADERAQRAEKRKAAEEAAREARRTAAAQGKAPAAQQPTEPAAAQETKEAAPKPRAPQKMQAAKARAAAGTSIEAAAEVVAAKAPDPAATEKAAPEEEVLQTEEDDEAFLRFARELGIQSKIQAAEGGRAARTNFADYFGKLSREVKNRIARAWGFTRDMLSKERQALFAPAKDLIDAATSIVGKLNKEVAAFEKRYPGVLRKRGESGPLDIGMAAAVNAAVSRVQALSKPGQFEPSVAAMAFTAREVLKIAQGISAKEGAGTTRKQTKEFTDAVLPVIAETVLALRTYYLSAKAAPDAAKKKEIQEQSVRAAQLLVAAWQSVGAGRSLPAEALKQKIPAAILFLAPEAELDADGHIKNLSVRAGRLPDLIPKGVPLEALLPSGDLSASLAAGGGIIDYTPDVDIDPALTFEGRSGELLPIEEKKGTRTQNERAARRQSATDMLANLDQGTEQRESRAAHAQEAALPLPEQQRRTEERMRREMKALGLESGSPQSMQTALEKIMGDPNQPAHLRELARMLYEIQAWRLATSFSIVTDPVSAAGNYDPATGAITLNLTRPNPRGLADALVHEIFHAATADAITKKHPAGSPEAAAAEYIQRLYSEAKAGYARRRQTIEGLLESLRELEADALLLHSPQRMRKLLAREKAKKNPLALDYSPDMSLDEVADMFAALQSSKGGYFALSEMIADFDYVFTAPEANGISLEFISHLTDSNFQLLLGNILTEPGTPSMLRRLWQRTTELLFNRVIPGTDRANSLKELLGHVRLLAGDPANMFFSAQQGRKFDGDEAQLAALARDARLKQATEKQAAAAAQLQSAALAIVALEKTDAAELGGITGELLISRAGAATALGLGNTSSLAIASALRARLQDANSNRKAELGEALSQYAVALDSEEQASREVARLTAEVAAAQPVRGLLPVSAAPGVDPAAAAAAVSEVRPGGTVPVVVEVDLAAAQAQGIEQLNPSALPLRNIRSAEIRDNFVRGMAALSALVDRGVLFPLSEVQQSDGTTRKIILWETEDRYVVVANVNGVRVPFYRSTGYAGKAEKGVPDGVWYPFFGINTSGQRWISKGTTKTDDINKSIPDFYGIGELRAIAEQLNEAFPRTKPSPESGVPKKYIADGYTQYLPGAAIDSDRVERVSPTDPGITADEFNRLHDMVPWAWKDPADGPITANLNRIREALVPPPAAEETPAEEMPPASEEPAAPAEPQPKNPLVRAAAFRLRGKTLITPADLQRELVLPDLALEGLISELQTEGLIGPVDEKGRHRVRPAKVRALLVAGATDRMGGLLESRAVAYADGNRIRLSISPEFNRRMASGELTVEDYGALDLALQSAETLAEQLFYEGTTDEVTEAPQVLGSRPASLRPKPFSRVRDAEMEQAAEGVKAGAVSAAEYNALVNQKMPLRKFAEVPRPATLEEVVYGLGEGVAGKIPKKTLAVLPEEIQAGQVLESRLDISAYEDRGIWVVSLHTPSNGKTAGSPVAYTSVALLKNVTFVISDKAALAIAGGLRKTTVARMRGEYVPLSAEDAYQMAVANKDGWTELGMNPVRHGYFYDKDTQTPVISAESVLQIGGMVLAKNPVFGNREDFLYSRPASLRPVSFYEAPQWLRDYMRRNNSAFESPEEADEWFASEQPQFLSNPAQWTSGASPDELAMMNWQVSRQIRRLTASGNPDTAMLMPGLAEQAKALSGISRINPFGEDAAEFYAMRTAFDPETHVPLDALKAIGITRSSRVAARTGFFTPGAVRTDPDHLELSAAMNAAYQTAPARTNPDQLLWLSAIMPVAGFNRAMDAYGRGPFTEALERFRNVARKMYPVIPMENLGKLTGMPEFFSKADATIRALTALSGTLDPKVSEEYIGRLTDALELDDRTAAQVERGYMNMVFRDGVADRRSRDAALARLQVDTGEILRGAAEDGAGAGTLEFTGAGGEAVVFADPKQRLVYKMYLPRITGRETGFGFALPAPVIGPDGQPIIEPFESPALGRSPLRQMLLEEHTQVPGLIDSEVVALTDSGAVITVQKQLTGEQIDTDAAAEPMRRWAQMHQATFLNASGIAPNFEAPATQNAVLIRDASGNLRMLLDFAPGNVFAAGPVLAPVDVLVSSPLSAETASHPTVSSAAGQLLGSRPISSPVGKFRAFLLSKRPGEFTKGLPDSRPDEVLNTTKFLWSVNMTRFGKFGKAAYPIRKEMDFRIRSLAQASDRLLNITMSRLPKDNPRIEELANIIAGSQDNLYDENMRMAAVTAFRKARMSAVRRYRKDIRRIRQTAVADEAGPETEAVQKAFDKALADAQADFRTALGEAVDVRVAEYKLEQEAARKELAAIPGGEDVLRAVEALRRKVDELSQYMLETVDLDPEVRVIITRSMGVYLTRTYQAHEDPEYMAMVRSADPVMEKRMSDALEYFQNRQKQEYINRHVIQFGRGSLEEARRAAAAWMAVSGDDAARMALHDFLMEHASVSHSGGSVGVLNRGILLEKTDIPEPLRRLLGQNKSNVAASARTVYELGRYNATHDFLANLQTLLSDADDSRRERIEELSNAQNPTDEDLKELADLEATVYITGDKSVAAKHGLMPFTDPKTGGASSAALGPLQNMYGPPLLVEAVSELTPEQVSTMTRAVQFITARAQMNLTVLSWKSQARNFGANGGWLLGAGHYNIWSAVWKPRVRAFLAASDDQKLAKQQLAEFYARYGVTGGSAISEVLEAISDAAGDNSAESLTRLYEGATGRAVKATRFLADKAAGLQEAAVGLYEKGDDVFKIAIFEAELADYAKAYGAEFGPSGELIVPDAAIPRIIEVFSGRNRLTRSMLREIGGSREALARELLLREAAAATRDSIAYYDQLPAAIEQFRRSAGIAVAPFVSYRVAMPMAVVGSAKRAWLDMQSPETRGKGLRRYLGLFFLFVGLTKVLGLFFQLAAAAFLGADDEEEKRLLGAHTTTERDLALRSLVSEWYRNRAISFLGITDDKKVLYTDISWLNPVSSLRDTFIPLLANPRLLRSWDDFRAGMVEAASKATEPFISPQVTIADVVKAAMSDDYEAQSRTVLEKAIAGAGAAISSAAVPGVATDVARIIKSMGTSRQAEEITSFIFGLRIKSLDLEQALQTQAFGTKKGLTAAAKPLRALKFDDTASPEDVQEAYQTVMERRKELLQRMRDAFESAKLFRNPSEVSAMLRSGDHGLSRREVADIERGVLSPYQLPDSTVAELFQSDARNGTEKGKSYRKAVADQTVQSLY